MLQCIRIRGFDHYHISLPREQDKNTGDSASEASDPSRLAEHCVDLIGKNVSFASNPDVVSQLVDDRLNPPSDVSFVHRCVV